MRKSGENEVSPYASPSRQTDYTGLPPAYTFVGDGEPFYAETVEYIQRLQEVGIPAKCDVYHTDMHAFDMLYPGQEPGKLAIRHFEEQYLYATEHYLALQRNNCEQ